MFKGCGSQVRAVNGGAYALDFGTVLTMASVVGADLPTVADLLPTVEAYVLVAHSPAEDS